MGITLDRPEKPKQLETLDTQGLRDVCQRYIDSIGTDDEREDDVHYIYEVAIETIFGKDVWRYINSKSR